MPNCVLFQTFGRKKYGTVRRLQEGLRRGAAQMEAPGRTSASIETGERHVLRHAQKHRVPERVSRVQQVEQGPAVLYLQTTDFSMRRVPSLRSRYIITDHLEFFFFPFFSG